MKRLLILSLTLFFPGWSFASCICADSHSLDLEISRAYPQPLEGEQEWVELYNTGTSSIDLSFYTLEDSTGKPMTLSGLLEARSHITITPLSFQLNNSQESLTLKTIEGLIVDELYYETSQKGESVPLTEFTWSEALESPEDLVTPTQWPEFSEALPNPEGNDSSEEWIELYNPHSTELVLTGLSIDDQEGGSSPYALSGSMSAYSYLIVSIEDSGLSLNNSTDEIRLLLGETVLWTLTYTDVVEGQSYAIINGTPRWTSPTPGASNHDPSNVGESSEDVELTEALPNPDGPDEEEEWIELTNGGDSRVNLGNWVIDDGPGGSTPYLIPENTWIEAGQTLVLDRPTTGLALNNSSERIELLDFNGELMDHMDYEKSQEGKSYSKITFEELQSRHASLKTMGGREVTLWEWTEPSPGTPNPIWKEFMGVVQSYENQVLSLKVQDQVERFEVLDSELAPLLFETGNTVLVKASVGDGFHRLIQVELLSEETAINTTPRLPWSFIAVGLLLIAGLSYEYFKKRRKKSELNAAF